MISLRSISILAKYFTQFDLNLLNEMKESSPPDEREITRRLRQMIEKELPWKIDEFDAHDWLHKFSNAQLSLEMRNHPTGWENKITYVDYGIVFSFSDEVLGYETQTSAYLIQAKRLYDNGKKSRYDLHSTFGGQKDWQTYAMRLLADYIGPNSVKFGLYCPHLSDYDKNSSLEIRNIHESNASVLYTGTPFGAALCDSINKRPEMSSNAGFWIAPITNNAHKSIDLHRTAFLESLPFGWFVIANLWNLATVGNPTSSPVMFGPPPHLNPWIKEGFVKHLGLNLGQDSDQHRLTVGLARGDIAAGEEIAALSGDRLPSSRFLPSVTFEIRMTRRLDPELRPRLDGSPPDKDSDIDDDLDISPPKP